MGSRFCPFCGQTNEAVYSFCQRCGKPLPPTAAAPPSSAPPNFPSPFVPPAPLDEPISFDGAPVERPLTDTERSALRASPRARNGNMARVFGTLMGITPLFLTVMAIGGTPFVPDNFTAIVLTTGVLAMVLGAGSAALRTPINVALKAGQVSEARGVAEKRPSPSGRVAVAFGGLDFLMKPALANRLPDGQLATLSFVVVGMDRAPRADRARALVLGVNGEAGSPMEASLAVPPDVAQSLRSMGRPGMTKRV